MEYFTPSGKPPYTPPIFDFAGRMAPRAFLWKKLLYDLLFSVYEIKTPENWLLSPFRYMLFGYGSLGVAWSNAYGWVYGPAGVSKTDWQYTPILFELTLANMENAKPIKGIRGINGAVIHIKDDWSGYDLMIDQYAKLLADLDKGIDTNVKQVKYGKIIGTDDKKDAATFEQALIKAEDGDPVVYVNKRLLDADGRLTISNLLGDIARDYIGDKIMETRLMILKDYLTRIGVRTVGLEKREHLLNQEIAENNDETSAEPYCVITSLAPELKLLNAMGCNLSIKPRYDYSGAGQNETKEGADDGKQDA